MSTEDERKIVPGNRWRGVLGFMAAVFLVVSGVPALLTRDDALGRPIENASLAYLGLVCGLFAFMALFLLKDILAPRPLVLSAAGFQSPYCRTPTRWTDVSDFDLISIRPWWRGGGWVAHSAGVGSETVAWRLRGNRGARDLAGSNAVEEVAIRVDGILDGLNINAQDLLQVMKDWHARHG